MDDLNNIFDQFVPNNNTMIDPNTNTRTKIWDDIYLQWKMYIYAYTNK